MARIWFVTGSSRGLGLALVEAILAAGDFVAATARKVEQIRHFDERFGHARVLTLALDVTNYDQAVGAIEAAKKKFGRLDVIVNNAGYADVTSIEDMSIDSFRAQMETNFFGVLIITKAVLPTLREQGFGHIIQVSSVGGRTGSPGLSAYQSAKWAVGGFSTVLSKEVASFGVKVTVIEPGGMATDWAGSSMGTLPLSEPYQETVGSFNRMREGMRANWGAPDKYADAILHISKVSDPPLRLLLGQDASQLGKHLSEQLAISDTEWRDVTLLSFS